MSIKELKKAKNISSESLFGIINQPKDTCPMIDKLIAFQSDLAKRLEKIIKLDASLPFGEECDHCEGFDKTDKLMELVNDASHELQSLVDLLKASNDQLEAYRRDCEDLRGDTTFLKQQIWSVLEEYAIIENNKIKEISEAGQAVLSALSSKTPVSTSFGTTINFSKMEEILEGLKNNILKAKKLSHEVDCEECHNYPIFNEQKEEVEKIEALIPESFYLEKKEELEEALNNYKNLISWSQALIDFYNQLSGVNQKKVIASLNKKL